MRSKHLGIVAIVAFGVFCLALSLGCAAKYKAIVVQSAVSADVTLNQFQKVERAVCNPAIQWPNPVTACTPTSAALGLTTAKHQKISGLLDDAFTKLADLAPILRSWKTGDAVPRQFTEMVALAQEINTELKALAPGDQAQRLLTSFGQVLSYIDAIAKVIGVPLPQELATHV